MSGMTVEKVFQNKKRCSLNAAAAVERKVNGSNEKGQTSILQTILKSEEQQTSSPSHE
jgi:hypothetical protein